MEYRQSGTYLTDAGLIRIIVIKEELEVNEDLNP